MKTPDQRFPKRERLASRSDFVRLYGKGRKIHSACFVLYAAPNQLGHHRLGLTVSQKVGNAAVRNLVKRRLREVYRLDREHIPCSCVDLVVSAKRSIAQADLKRLRAEFVAAVARIPVEGPGA